MEVTSSVFDSFRANYLERKVTETSNVVHCTVQQGDVD